MDLPLSPESLDSPLGNLGYSVIVVGSGNAGFSAAIAAKEAGAFRVLLIDKCPPEWAGGNTYFTAGAFRCVHGGIQDLLPLLYSTYGDDATGLNVDLEAYTEKAFLGDMLRVTGGMCDQELTLALVRESREAVEWLASNGLQFQLAFGRQSHRVSGVEKFFGGLCLQTVDGGSGLMYFHKKCADELGVEVSYLTDALQINLDKDTGAFLSLTVDSDDEFKVIHAGALVLAGGGFESSSQYRTIHLGPKWENVHVRGTPYNNGDCLEMAVEDANAKRKGQWSGCHSVAWDANAPTEGGDRIISNEFTKSGYPHGLTVNVNGERFFDEGSDLRNYTYAKFGRAILEQPDSIAFQVWDQKGIRLLSNEEYRDEVVEKIHGATIEELAEKCTEKGLEYPQHFVNTVRTYNEAVSAQRQENPNLLWNPAIKDGLSTQSSNLHLQIPKSNWARPIDEGPFMAVKVACGITFTFGGIAIDPNTAGVISNRNDEAVPGIFCAGEMVGGLFYDNYPGGSGLTSGTVFGRKAGVSAANYASRAVLSPPFSALKTV